MDIHTILLIIIIIYLIFLNYKEKNIEKFAEIDDITAAVKEIYNTDMNHIRTLSKISKKMYNKNENILNICGDLIVDGDINCNGITYVDDADKSIRSFFDVNYIIANVNTDIININSKYQDLEDVTKNYTKALKNKINLNSPVEFTYRDYYKLNYDPSNAYRFLVTNTSDYNSKWKIKIVK